MCGETDTPFTCSWECKLVQSFWKVTWQNLSQSQIFMPSESSVDSNHAPHIHTQIRGNTFYIHTYMHINK